MTLGTAIKLDTSRNIYVTGITTGNLDGQTCTGYVAVFVTKYNSTGEKQWTTLINGSGASLSSWSIDINSTGDNIYIAGLCDGSVEGESPIGSTDAFLITFNTSGIVQDIKIIGVAESITEGYATDLDSDDNIYITGSTTGNLNGEIWSGYNADAFIIKYNSAVSEQWTKLIATSSGHTAIGHSITHDETNNIYITGRASGNMYGEVINGLYDAFLTKVNSSGIIQWSRLYGNRDVFTKANSIIVDTNDNIYIAGYTNDLLDSTRMADSFVRKYNSLGVSDWTNIIESSPSIHSTIFGVTVDSNNHPFIAGYTDGEFDGVPVTGLIDAFVSTRVVPVYEFSRWTRLSGASRASTQGISSIVDSNGNSYVIGITNGALDRETFFGATDLFIIKYNIDGVKQWTRLTGTDELAAMIVGYGVTIGNDGNIYIVGYTNKSVDGQTIIGVFDYFIMKYNSEGTKQWTRLNGVISGYTMASNITKDSAGNIYIGGYTDGNLDGETAPGDSNAFISKFNSSFELQWTRLSGGVGIQASCFGCCVDTDSNVYTTGFSVGNLDGETAVGNQDVFIIKYNSSGVKQWTKIVGSVSNDSQGFSIDSDVTDNIYITGYSKDSFNGQEPVGDNSVAFAMKYNSSGVEQWTKLLGSTSTGANAYGQGITVTSTGDCYIVGRTEGGIEDKTLTGTIDMFIKKYLTDGTSDWLLLEGALRGGTPVETVAQHITLDSNNNKYIVGYTQGSLDGQSVTGTKDIFISSNFIP